MRTVTPSRLVPTDHAAYRRLRWRARIWTGVTGLVVAVTTAEIALRVTSGSEQLHASAAWVLFQGGLVLAALSPVVWFGWRRSFRARPRRLSVHDGPGAWIGTPELDEEPRSHLSLRADAEVPRRW